MFDKLAKSQGKDYFGPNTLPESEILNQIGVVSTSGDWQNFINAANRTFVESVEQYGVSTGRDRYFWLDIKSKLPRLWHALQRIKLYRNEEMHLVLKGSVIVAYNEYLSQDLGGAPITSLGGDVYFMLQQGVLDGLLNALQIETARAGG